jgi:hypothetical protein
MNDYNHTIYNILIPSGKIKIINELFLSLMDDIITYGHYYNSWYFKRSKLINKSFLINGNVHFDYKLRA